ncbi:hypothetical protein [Streptomyces vietnamensis]|uniref:hypothetical protein n=1 Tax=Streptomyces vietnamensis TaxID=362257 RepID=UPI00131AD394|nr:hypothetical protein [Streptomyces vietnamensis]
MIKRKFTVALAGFLTPFLAGCSSSDVDPASPTPSVQASVATQGVSEVRTGEDITLPLDAYVETPQQADVNDRAVELLAYSCMVRRGFVWPPPEKVGARKFGPMNARRYGVIDLGVAKESGYHAPKFVDDVERERVGQKTVKPSIEAIEEYTGRVSGEALKPGEEGDANACQPYAERQVYGAAGFKSQWTDLLQYHHRSFVDASKDSRVVRTMADWRVCMTSFGYKYEDVWEANNDPRWQSADISSAERLTAERDVRCKKKSRFPSVMLSVESELQEAHIKRHPSEFAEIDKYFKRAASKASAVVEQNSRH